MNNYPPSSVVVYSVSKDSPAEKAGMMQYDFITEIDGVRVTSLRELTGEMDKHQAGDTVEVTVVRYANPTQFVSANQYSQDQSGSDDSNDYFGNFGGFGGFGGYGGRYNQNNTTANSYETVKLNVTLGDSGQLIRQIPRSGRAQNGPSRFMRRAPRIRAAFFFGAFYIR